MPSAVVNRDSYYPGYRSLKIIYPSEQINNLLESCAISARTLLTEDVTSELEHALMETVLEIIGFAEKRRVGEEIMERKSRYVYTCEYNGTEKG